MGYLTPQKSASECLVLRTAGGGREVQLYCVGAFQRTKQQQQEDNGFLSLRYGKATVYCQRLGPVKMIFIRVMVLWDKIKLIVRYFIGGDKIGI
jgi:hypothetical protein